MRPLHRRDHAAVAGLLAAQYRRLHTADPRLSCPAQVERGARRNVDYDADLPDGGALVAERAGAMAGYLRAWRRHFGAADPQLMWLPADHLTCEVFYQFAAAAGEDPGAVFTALFTALARQAAAPPSQPWVLSLVPPGAGIDPALTALGFRATSVFAYRPILPLPSPAAPPPGIRIRPAAPGDDPALAQLYVELCAYHAQNDPYADRALPHLGEDFRHVLRTVAVEPRRWVLLVAQEAAGPPLAFALASVDVEEFSPSTITQLPPGRVGFIHDFMIAPGARRRGLGRALHSAIHAALMERAGGLGPRASLHGTWLIYRPTNPTGAHFWPALGYTPLYLMWRRGGWAAADGGQ